MTLSLYIVRCFFVSLLKVQIGIFSLLFLISTTEELTFLANKNSDLPTALALIGSRMPEQLALTFPLVILLGSLFTFLGLSRSSELVVIRAAGISAFRTLIPPMIIAVILGAMASAIFNPIVAATIRKHTEIRDSFSKSRQNQLSLSGDGIWLRQANESGFFVIQARNLSGDGVVLFNVRFHEFTTDGRLLRRVEAQHAQLVEDEWRLTQATQWRFLDRNLNERSDIRPFDVLYLPTNLSPEEILESFTPPDRMSIWKIPAFIIQLEASGFTSVRHRLFLQSKLSEPLLLAAMVLVGAVFAFRPSRFGNAGLMALLAVLSGFMLYAIKNIAESLGVAQAIPVGLAAWAPAVAATLFALALLLHLEDG